MKNEQQNNQNGKQDQSVNQNPVNNQRDQQQPKKDNWANDSTGKNQPQSNKNQSSSQSQGNDKSNIGVNSEGKIGKAHDLWENDNNNRNTNNNDQDNQQKDQQIKSDKTVKEPEIDAPIYNPEKTEKKLPQMGSEKNSK